MTRIAKCTHGSAEEAYKRLMAFYELAAKKEPVYQVMLDGIRLYWLN
jgi:hypothetical protein